jgi:hypothetical protein
MARRIRSADLETRTARLKLDVRKKPYTSRIALGIRLAYRRNQGGGVWSILKADGAGGAWLQRFALADDHEESNGSTVLTFWEAAEIARKLARGDDPVGEVEAGRPLTIRDAVAAYERDLKARDAGLENAKWLRYHLTPALMSKPVAMLTQREVRALRDSLIDKVPKRSTVNRFMRAFKACLTLAANDDERITNRKAWRAQSRDPFALSSLVAGPIHSPTTIPWFKGRSHPSSRNDFNWARLETARIATPSQQLLSVA